MYMAPEILYKYVENIFNISLNLKFKNIKSLYDYKKTDVFSLGLTFYEILHNGNLPYYINIEKFKKISSLNIMNVENKKDLNSYLGIIKIYNSNSMNKSNYSLGTKKENTFLNKIIDSMINPLPKYRITSDKLYKEFKNFITLNYN